MIHVLCGENSFEIERELGRLRREFAGTPETIDGADVTLAQLPDLLMGTSLFAKQRLVIIRNLSENKALWADFPDWINRVSDDVQLVLVEAKLDKRTKTYKELKKRATLTEFTLWSERDTPKAERWAVDEAKRNGCELSPSLARVLVARTGVDQWRLYHALQKLAVLDLIDEAAIRAIVDVHPSENVFALFETALRGDAAAVQDVIRTLRIAEDPYKVFGLLSSQLFQLVALTVADASSAEVAKDIEAHPFVLSKLSSYATKFSRHSVKDAAVLFVEADYQMKTSSVDPWLMIETLLVQLAHQQKK